MIDARIKKHAELLVKYSIEARQGETVVVSGTSAAEPLFVHLYEAILKAGAYPLLRMAPESTSRIYFTAGQKHHYVSLPGYQLALARSVDKYISIHSSVDTRGLSGVAPWKQAAAVKAVSPVNEIMRRKAGVITLFPTIGYARDASMTLEDFQDYVYRAMFLDEEDPVACWKRLRKAQEKLISKLKGAEKIRIVGKGTDLSLSVKGRHFVNSDGKRNMPSGEIYAAPVEGSVEGVITFDYPVCTAGREIDGVRLVFRKGRAVEATATKNEAYLKAMLDMDKGARVPGELGIGTNPRINRFIKQILYDEKIGGTIHLALGRSILESKGKNKSAIHWDMIKDLRRGGAIYVDGRPFQVEGRFVV